MSAAQFDEIGAPRWVAVVDRWRHIFERNTAELGQLTLLAIVGAWLAMPGAAWSPVVAADLQFFGIGEEGTGAAILAVAILHGRALWRRAYAARKAFSLISAAFWFSMACAVAHASPSDLLAPICAVQFLTVATTFVRLKVR